MKDVITKIECKGEEYKLAFNFNVMEDIQDKYGTLSKWGALCKPTGKEPNMKALKYGFWAMLNEGIDIENDEKGTNKAPLTLRQVGRLITNLGAESTAKALNDAVIESSKNIEKNESSTKNQ